MAVDRQHLAAERHHPLVSAILVFGTYRRARLANRAAAQFARQVYPNKQLVVVNAAGPDVPSPGGLPGVAFKEVRADGGPLGRLRNLGLDAADGQVVVPVWDDDDVYDPFYLHYLMPHCRPDRAVAAGAQVRVHIWRMTAYLHREGGGIPNTMLIPRSPARFDEGEDCGEDARFWREHWAGRADVVDTREYPLNMLKACVYHGNNVMPADRFLVGHDGDGGGGRWSIGPEETHRLRAALAQFGVFARDNDQEALPCPPGATTGSSTS